MDHFRKIKALCPLCDEEFTHKSRYPGDRAYCTVYEKYMIPVVPELLQSNPNGIWTEAECLPYVWDCRSVGRRIMDVLKMLFVRRLAVCAEDVGKDGPVRQKMMYEWREMPSGWRWF